MAVDAFDVHRRFQHSTTKVTAVNRAPVVEKFTRDEQVTTTAATNPLGNRSVSQTRRQVTWLLLDKATRISTSAVSRSA